MMSLLHHGAIYRQVEHCECVVGWVVQSSIVWLAKASSSDPDHVAEGLTLMTSVLILSGLAVCYQFVLKIPKIATF